MIILDTNVVSELMKPDPDPSLERWMDSLHPDDMYVSTITIAEMLTGVLRLSDGRRRETIEAPVRRIIEQFGPTYPSSTPSTDRSRRSRGPISLVSRHAT